MCSFKGGSNMQRNTETKALIKQAFTVLMKEKGFQTLTVSDITRKAGINRGTFYLHYVDKYDLLEKLENDLVEDLKEILLKKYDNRYDNPKEIIPCQAILSALYYVKNDLDFFQVLISEQGDMAFINRFKELLLTSMKEGILKTGVLNYSRQGLPEEYANEILLSGVASIIILWIHKGGVESPEEIAQMVNKSKDISPYELLM